MRRLTLTAALALTAALSLTGCNSLGLGGITDLDKLNEVFEELEQAGEAFDDFEKGEEFREEWNKDGEKGVPIPGDATLEHGERAEYNPTGGPGPFGDRDGGDEEITYNTTLEQAEAGYEEHQEKYPPTEDNHHECDDSGCFSFSGEEGCQTGECRGYVYQDNGDGTAKVWQKYYWNKD